VSAPAEEREKGRLGDMVEIVASRRRSRQHERLDPPSDAPGGSIAILNFQAGVDPTLSPVAASYPLALRALPAVQGAHLRGQNLLTSSRIASRQVSDRCFEKQSPPGPSSLARRTGSNLGRNRKVNHRGAQGGLHGNTGRYHGKPVHIRRSDIMHNGSASA